MKINKQIFIILFSICLIPNILYANNTDTINPSSTKKNIIRLDLGGRGLIYTIFYDRTFDLKYLDFHTVVGIGDISPWSFSYNTSIYFVPKFFKVNPIFGFSHVNLHSKSLLPVPAGIIYTGLDYNKLKRWDFQLIFNRMYFFYDKNNSQFFGGISIGYKL